MSETKTFWITKYALTSGIFTAECLVRVSDPDTSYASAPSLFCRIGIEAFDTEAAAIENAITRARRKIEAIAKQRTKLDKKIAAWVKTNA